MIHSRQIQSRAFIHPVILYLLQFDGINFLPRQRRFQWQDGITKSYIQLNSSIDFWSPSLQSRPRACKYLYFTKYTLIPCMFYVHHLNSNYELIKLIEHIECRKWDKRLVQNMPATLGVIGNHSKSVLKFRYSGKATKTWPMFFLTLLKGQLISKLNCRAKTSPKKRAKNCKNFCPTSQFFK